MTKLREVINPKLAVLGVLTVTALSGFVARPAQANSFVTSILIDPNDPNLPPYITPILPFPILVTCTRPDAAGAYCNSSAFRIDCTHPEAPISFCPNKRRSRSSSYSFLSSSLRANAVSSSIIEDQDTQFFQSQVFSEQSGFISESTFPEDFLADDEFSQPNNVALLQSEAVNEPGNAWGLLALGGLGINLLLKRRRRLKRNKLLI